MSFLLRLTRYVSFRDILFLTIAIRVLLSAWFLQYPASFYANDSIAYLDLAETIYRQGIFAGSDGTPEHDRVPGFPLVLALSFYLQIPIETFVAVLNSFFVLGIAFFTYKFSLFLDTSKHLARWSAMAVLLSPNFLLYQNLILSEILFTFFLFFALFLFAAYCHRGNVTLGILCSILFSAACFIRPIAVYLAYCMPALLLMPYFFKRVPVNGKKVGVACFISAIIIFGSVHWWSDRNRITGASYQFSGTQSLNINQYISAPILAMGSGRPWSEVKSEFKSQYDSWEAQDRLALSQNQFFDVVSSYPFESILLFSRGLLMNMFEPGAGDWLKFFRASAQNSGIVYRFNDLGFFDFLKYLVVDKPIFLSLTLIGFLFMANVWFWLFYRLICGEKMTPYQWVALAFIFYFLAISASAGSLSRFRIPVIPIIAMFAIEGWRGFRRENAALKTTR